MSQMVRIPQELVHPLRRAGVAVDAEGEFGVDYIRTQAEYLSRLSLQKSDRADLEIKPSVRDHIRQQADHLEDLASRLSELAPLPVYIGSVYAGLVLDEGQSYCMYPDCSFVIGSRQEKRETDGRCPDHARTPEREVRA